jgi:hypothetical protein
MAAFIHSFSFFTIVVIPFVSLLWLPEESRLALPLATVGTQEGLARRPEGESQPPEACGLLSALVVFLFLFQCLQLLALFLNGFQQAIDDVNGLGEAL